MSEDNAGEQERYRVPQWVFGAGKEPDPRFSLANERTFLAWIRTAMALVTEAVLAAALLGVASLFAIGMYRE